MLATAIAKVRQDLAAFAINLQSNPHTLIAVTEILLHSYVHKKIHILQVAECYAAHSMHMVRGDKLLDSDVRSKTLSLGVEQGLGTRD